MAFQGAIGGAILRRRFGDIPIGVGVQLLQVSHHLVVAEQRIVIPQGGGHQAKEPPWVIYILLQDLFDQAVSAGRELTDPDLDQAVHVDFRAETCDRIGRRSGHRRRKVLLKPRLPILRDRAPKDSR